MGDLEIDIAASQPKGRELPKTAIVGDSVRANDRLGSFGPDFARSGNSFADRGTVALANEAKRLWAGHNLASPGDVIFAIV